MAIVARLRVKQPAILRGGLPLATACRYNAPRMKLGLKVVLAVVAVAVVVAAFVFLPLSRFMLGFVEWVRSQGSLGVAVFAVVYVLAAVLLLPASVLTLGAGFIYGPVWGTLLVSPVSVAAATAAFLTGRFFARDFVARRMRDRPRFAAVDEALAEGGLKIVILLRLSPVLPFNVLNYALGASRVRLPTFVLGSFIGMLPATLLYVYLGSLVTQAGQLLGKGEPQEAQGTKNAFYWVGLAATVVVTVLITRSARRALQKAVPNGLQEEGA